ncbi:MAG TPA: HEAT repeat domain-containing protein [Ktedonobacteraceae bacterium]
MDYSRETEQSANLHTSLPSQEHRTNAPLLSEDGKEKLSLHQKLTYRLGLQGEASVDTSTEALMSMLQSPDASLRASGALQLKAQRYQLSIRTYHAVLVRLFAMAKEDSTYIAQIAAIRALEAFGEASFRLLIGEQLFCYLIETFLQCLEDTQPEPVRMIATQAIGKAGKNALVETHVLDIVTSKLFIRASDTHWSTRAVAIQTIGKLKLTELADTVVVALEDQDYSVRVEAVRALYQLKGRESYPRLANAALQDHNLLVREAAYLILGIPMPELRESSQKEIVPFYQWILERKLLTISQGYEKDLLRAYEKLLEKCPIDSFNSPGEDQVVTNIPIPLRLLQREEDQPSIKKEQLLHSPPGRKTQRRLALARQSHIRGEPSFAQTARERYLPYLGKYLAILLFAVVLLIGATIGPLYAAIDKPTGARHSQPILALHNTTAQMVVSSGQIFTLDLQVTNVGQSIWSMGKQDQFSCKTVVINTLLCKNEEQAGFKSATYSSFQDFQLLSAIPRSPTLQVRQSLDWKIVLQAPINPGNYRLGWQIVDRSGVSVSRGTTIEVLVKPLYGSAG